VLITLVAPGSTGYYPIEAVLEHNDAVTERVVVDGEEIVTTPEHPFYTAEGGWTDAKDLEPGDHLRKADGSYGVVETVTFEDSPRRMYNLTVGTAHTFFVGEGQWLVHNACNIIAGGGASIDNIPPSYRSWIEKFAERYDTEVTVVGSHAAGTSDPYSDWDYLIGGKSKIRTSARHQLPHGLAGGELNSSGFETGIDVYNANDFPLDISRPYIKIIPK
jgi:hypothetical protein